MASIPEKFLKPYSPTESEGRIYDLWEKSGFFNPDNLPPYKGAERTEAYTIMLPPPNVTGTLHMGSALMAVIEDVLIRKARMSGKKTLWVPGTDSAAIATQAKVEKEIQKKEGKNRNDLGREELLKRIDIFVEENKSTILRQFRAIGASLDWSRYAYTMDETRYRAVMEAFVRMHDAGLIYRENRIVNWDPKGQTVISDDEIVYEERDAILYTFRYFKDFPIAISTTRPETKVGDTAVAVHPSDERYKAFVGKEYTGECAGKKLTIRIIADESVEKEFGTGALGVTPAHSHTDWEIADRHTLPRPQIINEYARMTEAAGPLVAGLKVEEAREKIVSWIREQGLLEKEEPLKQNVSTAERTGGIIEPLPKLQWWVAVDKPFVIPYSEISGIASGSETTLKKIMSMAVESGAITIMPDRFNNVYFNWINNLRPWCISRQIWFGHRVPVWYKDGEIKVCIHSPGEGWEQDPDVLDTWFSSALWTFSTLGWPEGNDDLKHFHPTSVLETGYDIIFFWVARMILMSGFHLGQIPFKTVYLHGLVRDGQGRKISKSLGNNIDPIEMGEKYGMDAVRMSLLVGTAPGADSRISEDKIKAYKLFANKVWNITRFILQSADVRGLETNERGLHDDTKLLEEMEKIAEEVTADIENYRLHLATEKLYQYVWHRLADEIIEESKPILAGTDEVAKMARSHTLYTLLITSLKLLHPFMPFITEEIWQSLPKKECDLLMVAKWPDEV